MSFGHSARTWHAGGHWRFTSTHLTLTGSFIIYPSRLNEATNLAIYHRAVRKLQAKRVVTLLGALGLAQVLEDFRVGLV